ncbi:hypothetical protein D9Q98_004134 [Chlorella vulgaris]|uniref:Uncharacterized protein n=1 Tax=Chlorella vulgaris TaxID=3077 RepID=A0A9D4TRQ5_CHLVU|nr:hypothetical protein D9Q98_004134 [Chlorella vulgaris]
MPPIGLVGHAARQLAAACRALHYMPSLQQFAAIEELADGILRGCRLSVSRGVTLTESSRLDHQLQAAKLLRELQKRLAERRESSGLSSSGSNSTGSLLPLGAAPLRIGISGPPGAGKSSLIETLGCALVEEGERVAVLAIDPSSQASGGAILGDKTRMPRLSASLEAYVRPSPARGTLGGVARATFDAILICEAAGYSKVLVETVGVGQSETAVQDLVDIFVLVLPPVGGDELQVIKRGVTEMADIVVINKADGSTEAAAARAAAAFRSTLSFHRKRRQSWQPTVLTCSAHTGLHVDKLLQQLAEYQAAMQGSGELARLRRHQRQRVAWTAAEEAVLDAFRQSANVRWLLGQMTPDIASGALAPRTAAELLAAYNAMYD